MQVAHLVLVACYHADAKRLRVVVLNNFAAAVLVVQSAIDAVQSCWVEIRN